jgi:hypothetical protein
MGPQQACAVARATLAPLALALLLGGCGPDAVTAAAGTAGASAAAARQAHEQQEKATARIKALEDAEQKRVQGIDEQVEPAPERAPH